MGHQTPTLQAHQRPTYRKQFNFWRKTHKWYNLHLWLKGRVFTFIGHQCGFVKFTARTQPPTALWQTAPPWGNFTETQWPWAQPHFFLALPPPPGPASSSPHSQEQVGPYPIPGISSDSCIIWIPVPPRPLSFLCVWRSQRGQARQGQAHLAWAFGVQPVCVWLLGGGAYTLWEPFDTNPVPRDTHRLWEVAILRDASFWAPLGLRD